MLATASVPRVLIIEDDPNVAEVVSRYVEREGYRVDTVADGALGLRAALDDPPDLVVLDACGGIPAGDLDHVFEMAYRGDTARTPGDGGSGLGLAVARGLVEAHHGDISVRNEASGCRFTVRLPLSVSA